MGAFEAFDREIEFSPQDFERIRKLIYAKAGISLSPAKQQMAYSRLARRVRATGTGSFGNYLDRLEATGGEEWQEFVNALTTNLTSFFREQHHFPILAEFARESGKTKPVKLWCAAASTGEEPYSIAMTLKELGPAVAGWRRRRSRPAFPTARPLLASIRM